MTSQHNLSEKPFNYLRALEDRPALEAIMEQLNQVTWLWEVDFPFKKLTSNFNNRVACFPLDSCILSIRKTDSINSNIVKTKYCKLKIVQFCFITFIKQLLIKF